MWKSAYVGVYQLLNWKMHGEIYFNFKNCKIIFTEPKSKPGSLSQYSLQSEQQQF